MKLQEFWKDSDILVSIVPLAIDACGFAYLNDICLWNITINDKHRSMKDHRIEVKTLRSLIEHARCASNQCDALPTQQARLLKRLEKLADNDIFTF